MVRAARLAWDVLFGALAIVLAAVLFWYGSVWVMRHALDAGLGPLGACVAWLLFGVGFGWLWRRVLR